MKKFKIFLGHFYFDIFSNWPPIVRFIVFISSIGIPIDFFQTLGAFGDLISLVWVIFIFSIPRIAIYPGYDENEEE